jgi:hypothetical protein
MTCVQPSAQPLHWLYARSPHGTERVLDFSFKSFAEPSYDITEQTLRSRISTSGMRLNTLIKNHS